MGSPGMLQGFPTPSCWEGGRGQNPAFAGGAEAGWVGRGLGQVVGSAGDVSPCPQGGEVECSFAPCPVLDCPQHQRHLGPGQCCFTCRDPPAPAGEPVLGGTWGQAGWDLGGGGDGDGHHSWGQGERDAGDICGWVGWDVGDAWGWGRWEVGNTWAQGGWDVGDSWGQGGRGELGGSWMWGCGGTGRALGGGLHSRGVWRRGVGTGWGRHTCPAVHVRA